LKIAAFGCAFAWRLNHDCKDSISFHSSPPHLDDKRGEALEAQMIYFGGDNHERVQTYRLSHARLPDRQPSWQRLLGRLQNPCP